MSTIRTDQARIGGLLEQLMGEAPALFAGFPVDRMIAAFDSAAADTPYTHIPDQVAADWRAITGQYGSAGFATHSKVTMLTLMRDFDERSSVRRYTPAVLDRFGPVFNRILGQIEDPAFSDYEGVNDLLMKDLALCRQKMFSVGAQLVEDHSGLSRGLILKGGPGQALRFLNTVILRTGGASDFYQIHTHLLDLIDFNPQGWETAMTLLAEMLAVNADVRGVFGASWFFDPALEEISPRLVYLSQVLLDKGGHRFYSHADPDSGALATSNTRQQLYETGRYLPKVYFIVWPRRAALKWLEQGRDGKA